MAFRRIAPSNVLTTASIAVVLSSWAPPSWGQALSLASHQELMRKYRIDPAREPKLPVARTIELLRQKVRYVFVLYQENRSFDSYFGTFPGAEGLFTHAEQETPGFHQAIMNTDGTLGVIQPFRIGPREFAANLDDVDHSHPLLLAKMNIQNGTAGMTKYAMAEEMKFSPFGNPSLRAKQMAELTMAYTDCDTVPLYWLYADRFVLFDHIFQQHTAPSTSGGVSIIAAQSGETQWSLHPSQAFTAFGSSSQGLLGIGVPLINDNDPFWGSKGDPTPQPLKLPVAPSNLLPSGFEYGTAINLTFASLPLTMLGRDIRMCIRDDKDIKGDLSDVKNDIDFISRANYPRIPFGWYQEGYRKEPTDGDGPLGAYRLHHSYVTHHNGPQYFGYVANNRALRAQLHGLKDFFDALESRSLPSRGVFFVKGGYTNILGLKPANPDPSVQMNFRGDDDHPGYSDSQISEALVAMAVNKIASSPYWKESAIIVTWATSEGSFDHVPPPVKVLGPDGSVLSSGPRVPLILISPYARTHFVAHRPGNHASVVRLIETVFALPALALLPDEARALSLGNSGLRSRNQGPQDNEPDVSDLVEGFSPSRLLDRSAPLPADYAHINDDLIWKLPPATGLGCESLGITTTDRMRNYANPVPKDFNPRPMTSPSSK